MTVTRIRLAWAVLGVMCVAAAYFGWDTDKRTSGERTLAECQEKCSPRRGELVSEKLRPNMQDGWRVVPRKTACRCVFEN